ncbi:hypothetical protein K438DRAFT_1845886 [Mycena galopus ATCC 62051]|nr:hypothetical protein K438DRAFT_1862573 [Mycena galopus ATCC 62051]KAF8177071.1 hypothetical protein K438DRAFT_1845886 [Mycena galopus ATCC 62051]
MQNTDQPSLHRVPELWFEEDNLILRAENTLFRVSKGVLAARSSVFRDMLSFPLPPKLGRGGGEGEDEEDTIDGCPVVRLHDSPADVTCFLRAIFDSSYFEPPPAKTDLAAITGILRLSHKYDVQYLRRRALLHLDTGYPTSLGEYEVSGSETFSSDGLDDSLLTIHVASEVNATWLLPTAFYFLCYSDLPLILASPAWPLLSPLNQSIALQAYTKQRLACPPVLPFLRIPFPEGCTDLERCSAYRESYLGDVASWNISDPLGSYKDWSPFEGKVCPYCLKKGEEYHRGARRRLWEDLPGMYGLPAWDVLERLKGESLAVEVLMGC